MSSTCPHNMVNFGLLVAEIGNDILVTEIILVIVIVSFCVIILAII